MKNKKVVSDRIICKKWIVLLGMAGTLLGLTGCGKEKGVEEFSHSSKASEVSERQSGIQTGDVEGAEAEGNYYEGEYERKTNEIG